jgi:uncharacterized alkaline shock family protein YloU
MTDTLSVPDADRVVSAASGRGWTRVSDGVIEKIASQAAFEVEPVGGRGAHRLLGVALPGMSLSGGSAPRGAAATARPRVTAHVDGHLARLSMSVGVHYPAPLRQVAVTVRARVVETVARLAALEVREVDIDVVALPRDRTPVRRVR